MNLFRKAIAVSASAFIALGSAAASAQEYPSEAVELINPVAPGGGTDIFLRMLSSTSGEHFEGDFVVESKEGGQGIVSMNYLNNRPADGHTLLAFTSGQLLALAEDKGPFEIEDLAPVVVGTIDPMVLIAQPGAFNGVEDLIAQGSERALMSGGTNAGTLEWMALMAFADAAGMQEPRYLPTQSGGEVVLNVIGGNIEVGVGNLTEVTERVENGELDALVVMSDERSEALPDVPTAKESGADVSLAQVRGLVALADTPEDRIEMLESAFLEGMSSDQYQEYLTSNGLDSSSVGDSEKWGRMMTEISERMAELRQKFSPDQSN